MYKKIFYLTIIVLPAILLVNVLGSCDNGKKINKDSTEINDLKNPALIKFNGRLFSVPSPIQVAMLVKEANIPYNRDLLNQTSRRQNYTTNFKQALNLGIYGADLGYLNTYDQLPDAASYFAVIRIISRELGILNSISESTMKRIEANNNNKDSLIYILSTMYRDADAYLLNNQRNDVGVLVLAGGWVESVYLMTQSLKQNQNQAILERIGEQKYPLDNLITLLRPYYSKESEQFCEFLEQLADLATVFDGVVIEYSYAKPTVDGATKTTTVNSKTKTIITPYQLNTITQSIEKIRNKIIE